MKKILKGIVIAISTIIFLCVVLLGGIYAMEYKPEKIEQNNIIDKTKEVISLDKEYKLMTFNTGYAGLDKKQDFVLDGGEKSKPDSFNDVVENIEGIKGIIKDINPDILLMQEVDRDAKRTYGIDEYLIYANNLENDSTYAKFFDSKFVPFPLNDMIGKVESGMVVSSKYDFNNSTRIDLPSAFKFPVRAFQSKRALMRQEFAIKGTDKKLIVYNLHLEAYEENNTRQEQLKILVKCLEEDYNKGNYVIAGGDFNQRFHDADNAKYKTINEEFFVAPIMEDNILTDNFKFVFSDVSPTARLLNEPFNGNYDTTQVFVIDGFIISKNIEIINTEVKDYRFEYSDHNPVVTTFKLK